MKKASYLGLWLLLSIALIGFVTFSFADDISIGAWTPKKAPFKEMLTKDRTLVELTPEEQKARLDSIRNVEEEVKVDSAAHSILLIGDSMTLNLAYRLVKYAKQNGHTFHAVNWDSSNTKTWASCDTLDYFINKYDASYIFVSLGSNELTMKNPNSRLKYVKTILEKIGDIPYIWIGPPNWTEDFGINTMIEENCKPRSFFLTNGMKLARKKDRIHPTRDASADWIDSVARWMPKSSHPILMNIPPDTIGKVNPNVTFLKAWNK